MDRVSEYLQTVLFVARAHWQAAMARLWPPVQAALDWMHASIQAAIAQTASALHAAAVAVRPHLQGILDAFGPYWQPIAITAVVAAAVTAVLVKALGWWRRRRRVRASLVEVTLDRDPQTEWLSLAIVVRNFQPHALTVRNLQVLQPAGTKVCERWKAWEPADGSARFVAAGLELTDAAAIERTIRPHGASGRYDDFGDDGGQRQIDPDEIKRSFYLLPPRTAADTVSVRGVLHCEIETDRRRTQRLAFRRTLTPAAEHPSALPSP